VNIAAFLSGFRVDGLIANGFVLRGVTIAEAARLRQAGHWLKANVGSAVPLLGFVTELALIWWLRTSKPG
jgi:hypothetical protein